MDMAAAAQAQVNAKAKKKAEAAAAKAKAKVCEESLVLSSVAWCCTRHKAYYSFAFDDIVCAPQQQAAALAAARG